MWLRRDKTEMVSPEDALPGRPDLMPLHDVHAVLGTSMRGPHPEGSEIATFGMGCFWGAERFFWQVDGVHTTSVGYSGGFTPNPTYEEVCTAQTGHNEVTQVVYDPTKVDYDALLKIFWENHDPTQFMGQGNDIGTQYRSEIFVTTPEQRVAAEASRDRYQASLSESGFGEITTMITDAGEYFFAEDYHQQYLHKNPGGYCNHGFCQVSYD
jgi:peptide-methionine (S)-S-oxide reductase